MGKEDALLPQTVVFNVYNFTLLSVSLVLTVSVTAKLIIDWRKSNKSERRRPIHMRRGSKQSALQLCGLPEMKASDVYSFLTCVLFSLFEIIWMIGIIVHQAAQQYTEGVILMLIGGLLSQLAVSSVMMVLVHRLDVFDDSMFKVTDSVRWRFSLSIGIMTVMVLTWHVWYSWVLINETRSGRSQPRKVWLGLIVLGMVNFCVYSSILFGLVWLFSNTLVRLAALQNPIRPSVIQSGLQVPPSMVNANAESVTPSASHAASSSLGKVSPQHKSDHSVELGTLEERSAMAPVARLSKVATISHLQSHQQKFLRLGAKQTTLVRLMVVSKLIGSVGITAANLLGNSHTILYVAVPMIHQISCLIPLFIYLSFNFGDPWYHRLCYHCDRMAIRQTAQRASLSAHDSNPRVSINAQNG